VSHIGFIGFFASREKCKVRQRDARKNPNAKKEVYLQPRPGPSFGTRKADQSCADGKKTLDLKKNKRAETFKEKRRDHEFRGKEYQYPQLEAAINTLGRPSKNRTNTFKLTTTTSTSGRKEKAKGKPS